MNNPLPGLPLIESPLFPRLLPALGFTPEEERIGLDLFTHGYAVFNFPDPELDARIERIKASLGPSYGLDFDNPKADKTCGERRIQDAWAFDADVYALAANSQVKALLSKLYGREAFPFQTLNFPVGTQQEAHSDMVHFSSQPEKFMCGVWIALEDIHADAGPLFYYPGSHRWPVMNNALIGRRGHGQTLNSAQDPFTEAWAALVEAEGAGQEVFLARKGQALIWCANLLHGGSAQVDQRLTRWSQVTSVNSAALVSGKCKITDPYKGSLSGVEITLAAVGLSSRNDRSPGGVVTTPAAVGVNPIIELAPGGPAGRALAGYARNTMRDVAVGGSGTRTRTARNEQVRKYSSLPATDLMSSCWGSAA